MTQVDKVIVTHKGALRTKYGDAGADGIVEKLNDLALVDPNHLQVKVVGLDDEAEMEAIGAGVSMTRNPLDPIRAKKAIDEVYAACQPHYLMIFGGIDIVPQQQLINPMKSDQDLSDTVPSDLPYACDDTQYSTDIAQFTGPTRVIGRLPDVTKYANPALLEGLLHTATSAISRKQPGNKDIFAISTEKWIALTRATLYELFPDYRVTVDISPGGGPDWTDSRLKLPVHFINCHGGRADCRFYGESKDPPPEGASDPVAHDSACIAGRGRLGEVTAHRCLSEGTVVVTECCFGAQLFDPLETGGVAGICTTYLANGAYAFFGSSGVAYGGEISPAGDGIPESADVLCGLFLGGVLGGASTGDAALSAVQEFIHRYECDMNPMRLKTIAQFSLMGDPSVHPFLSSDEPTPAKGPVPAGGQPRLHLVADRAARRADLAKRGAVLRASAATASHPVDIPDRLKTIQDILQLAGAEDWGEPDLRSFLVTPGEKPQEGVPTFVHILTRPGARQAPFPVIELIVANEVDGHITSFRYASSR